MKFIPKTWPRRIGLGFLAILLIGPFLIPVTTSGTLNYKDAAAPVWKGESKWMQLSGHEVHYVTAGDPNSDRLIVLMHGFGASAFSYKYVMEDLAELGYVVAYDRAAFGFTERPTEWEVNPYGVEGQLQVLNELIAELGLNKDVVLVGHSAGGSLAASFVIENPDVVDELVLFAPAVLTSGGAPGWMNWVFSIPQIDHLGPLLVSQIATAGMDILYSSYYDESKVTAEILAGYTAPLKVEGWEQAFWEFNRAPRDETVGERINEITIPTLIITGDTDKIVPTEDSIKVSQIIEGSQLVVISRTGHLPNEEAPEEFVDAVVQFLLSGD